MAEVKWVKIVTDIFDNRKIKQIESLPEGDTIIVIWFKILCLAGTINDNGNIYITQEIPYTDETLATQFNRPLKTIQLALHTFQSFGMIEIIDDILKVSNWETYQNVAGMEKIREQTRKRVHDYRERKKQELLGECNADVTLRNATDKNKNRIDIDSKNTIIKVYEEEIGLATQNTLITLDSYLEDLSEEMIIEAIKRASKQNKKSLAYIEGILKNWIRNGYKVLADVPNDKKKVETKSDLETFYGDLSELYEN